MNRLRRPCTRGLLVLSLAASAGAAAIPTTAWTTVRLAPDGRQVAAVASGSDPALWLAGTDSAEQPRRFQLPDGVSVADFVWAGREHVICLGLGPDASGGLWSVHRTRLDGHLLKPPPGGAWVRLMHPQPAAARVALIEGVAPGRTHRAGSGQWLDLMAVDPETGHLLRATHNPGDVVQWISDDAGMVRGALAVDGAQIELRVRKGETLPIRWHRVTRLDAVRDPASLVAMTSDGDRAWLTARLGRDTLGLSELDVPGARIRRMLVEDPRFDITTAPVLAGSRPIAVAWERMLPHTEWLDSAWAAAVRPSAERNRDQAWIPVEASLNGDAVLFRITSDRQPDRWAWIRREDPTNPRWLEPPAAPAPALGFSRRPVEWTARDGEPLSGYVTRPPGAVPGRLVVLIHGGPWTRDTWAWSSEAHVFATSGWTVLQVNYRGSAGFGRRFQELGAGRWGAGAVEDLADGVAWAVAHQLALPGEVAVAGASFGGYLAALALETDGSGYRAGASLGAAFDLKAWLEGSGGSLIPAVRRVRRAWLEGPRGDLERPRLEALQVPFLVLHARDDTVIPSDRPRRAALRAVSAGAPVTFEFLERGGHWLESPGDSVNAWMRIESFLSRPPSIGGNDDR